MISVDLETWFNRLNAVERGLAVALDENPADLYTLAEWNRIRLMKETLRLITGTSELTMQTLAQGATEWGDWSLYRKEAK